MLHFIDQFEPPNERRTAECGSSYNAVLNLSLLCGSVLNGLGLGLSGPVVIDGLGVGVDVVGALADRGDGVHDAVLGTQSGGGGFSLLVNILWLLLSGMEMALGYVILGCLWCVTIVGVPVGLQCFKMARLALMPFGASVV